MTITAIPQTYAGTRFRSKLEATWALNLDALGIAWAYEPEAFTLPSGANYLPDFWLPELDTWLEVKGPGVGGLSKAYELAGLHYHQPDCAMPYGAKINVDCCWGNAWRAFVIGVTPINGLMRIAEARPSKRSARGDENDTVPALMRCGLCRANSFMPVYGLYHCRKCGGGNLIETGDGLFDFKVISTTAYLDGRIRPQDDVIAWQQMPQWMPR